MTMTDGAAGVIVQFGTSRFLQAHVDLFASEAADAGARVPPIVIVQTTRDPIRARRLGSFADPTGFPVIVRGHANGERVDRTVQVRSVRDGISAADDWPRLVDLFVARATHVVSNAGDRAYDVPDDACRVLPRDVAPPGLCAMLTELLHRRWQAGRPGVTMLPCELIARNGTALRAQVHDLALRQDRGAAFLAWLAGECRWANTLVDRIVSAPLEPAGAVTEPYALWAVERQPGLVMPFAHPAIVLTDDLEPFERLKLHILNLGHSWLAARWDAAGRPAGLTVRAAMADRATRAAMDRLIAAEVIPGFAAHDMAATATAYAATTLDRFENPFLDHPLADIFGGHAVKLDKRVGGFVRWVDQSGRAPAMPELRALAAGGTPRG